MCEGTDEPWTAVVQQCIVHYFGFAWGLNGLARCQVEHSIFYVWSSSMKSWLTWIAWITVASYFSPLFFFSFACLNALTRILECTFYFLPIGYSTAACASLADMSMLLSLMTQNTHCPFCQWLLCVSYIAEEWADQCGKGIRWPIKLPCSI